MSSSVQITTKNGRLIARISLTFFILANFIWLFLPFLMAGLWSLVDPAKPWSYPDIFPQSLSFERWKIVWETTSLPEAMFNSYTIAPTVSLITILLSLPTAYAFGRMEFRGKKLAELLTLIPLVIPGMIIALFFSRMLLDLNINNPFIGIVIGHVVLTLPYAIRILSAGFSSVPQDLIDASRDLGASKFTVFKDVYCYRFRYRLTRLYYRANHFIFFPRLFFYSSECGRCIDYFVGTKHYFDDDYRKIVERELSLSIHRKSIIFTRSILCKKISVNFYPLVLPLPPWLSALSPRLPQT